MKKNELMMVCGLSVTLIYGWGVCSFLWRVSGWLSFLQIGDVLLLFSYALAASFFDSILFLSFLFGVRAFLPKRWLLVGFVWRMGVFVFVFLSFTMFVALKHIPYQDVFFYMAGALIVFFFVQFFFERVRWFQAFLEGIAERSIVFLYIYIPLTAVAFLSILIWGW